MIVLESDRLIIRDNIPSDLQDHFKLISDEINMKYLPEIKVSTLYGAKKNLKESIRESKKENRTKYFFGIVEKRTHCLIGSIGYTVESTIKEQKRVNLGYFLKKEYWGKGYTTEACREIIKFAFTKDNVIKIETGCLKENYASEKVMIKSGMIKEGTLVKHQIHENTWKDRVVYGITKEEWLKSQ